MDVGSIGQSTPVVAKKVTFGNTEATSKPEESHTTRNVVIAGSTALAALGLWYFTRGKSGGGEAAEAVVKTGKEAVETVANAGTEVGDVVAETVAKAGTKVDDVVAGTANKEMDDLSKLLTKDELDDLVELVAKKIDDVAAGTDNLYERLTKYELSKKIDFGS